MHDEKKLPESLTAALELDLTPADKALLAALRNAPDNGRTRLARMGLEKRLQDRLLGE